MKRNNKGQDQNNEARDYDSYIKWINLISNCKQTDHQFEVINKDKRENKMRHKAYKEDT